MEGINTTRVSGSIQVCLHLKRNPSEALFVFHFSFSRRVSFDVLFTYRCCNVYKMALFYCWFYYSLNVPDNNLTLEFTFFNPFSSQCADRQTD